MNSFSLFKNDLGVVTASPIFLATILLPSGIVTRLYVKWCFFGMNKGSGLCVLFKVFFSVSLEKSNHSHYALLILVPFRCGKTQSNSCYTTLSISSSSYLRSFLSHSLYRVTFLRLSSCYYTSLLSQYSCWNYVTAFSN